MFHRRMVALATVMQNNLLPRIFGDREAYRVAVALGRKPGALAGIAEIAEISQLRIFRLSPLFAGGASAAEARSQRKPVGKRPIDAAALFGGKEIRTSHGMPILVPIAVDMVDFFLWLR
jgi:hypothetical protein